MTELLERRILLGLAAASTLFGLLNWIAPRTPSVTPPDSNKIYAGGRQIGKVANAFTGMGSISAYYLELYDSERIYLGEAIEFRGLKCVVTPLPMENYSLKETKQKNNLYSYKEVACVLVGK